MNLQQILDELQSLDMQNPGSWPSWARGAAVAFAGLLILAAGYFVMIKPQIEELDAARLKETTLFTEFETKQKKVAALDAYKEQLKEMERSFGAMLRQLPSKAEVANLLNDISQTRVAASLEEELFKPQPDVPREFYAQLPNTIVVVGEYHQMGTFVSGVAALPRIVTIDDIEIRPVKAAAAKGEAAGPPLLRMQAVATTYRYLDEEEISAAAVAKPGAPPLPGGKK